jgi:hypothetical protein
MFLFIIPYSKLTVVGILEDGIELLGLLEDGTELLGLLDDDILDEGIGEVVGLEIILLLPDFVGQVDKLIATPLLSKEQDSNEV